MAQKLGKLLGQQPVIVRLLLARLVDQATSVAPLFLHAIRALRWH